MKVRYLQKQQLFYFIPLCILISILLTSMFSYSIKQDLIHQFNGIKFVVDSDLDSKIFLHYTFSEKFDEVVKLDNISIHPDTLFFKFPSSGKIVKKFRLDFAGTPINSRFKILEMQLLFKDKIIVFDQEEVFDNLYKNSASVDLDKTKQIIYLKKDVKPFDPYIIFLPLAQWIFQKSNYPIVLIAPFFIFVVAFLVRRKHNQYRIKILDFLILLFIICIPLKIAWTTFCTLLLCLYGLIHAISQKKINVKNSTLYVFLGVFFMLILFGRPSTFSVVEKQLSFLLFAIVSSTIILPKYRVYKFYTMFMLILNAIMLASAVGFLIWFNEFYALEITDYFGDIKTYNSNIRKWFYYDHAAFLSFFGLIGVLFLHKLYDRKDLNFKLLCLYHILLFLFIVFIGTRICLLIYGVFLLNMIVKWNDKKRILINTIVFLLFALILTFYIQEIDINRHHLWSVSWEAIKEKPFFGFGLGQSDAILHNNNFINKAGFTRALSFNHSHNQFITFLLEIGIVGVSLLFGALVYFLYKTKVYKNTTLTLFFFGLGYMFLTESVLETSKPLYVICFLFIIITSNKLIDVEQENLD